jgi:hypothetical protein
MKSLMADIKLYAINATAVITTTLTDLELWLKIILLLITIGYTITRWYGLYKNKINEK